MSVNDKEMVLVAVIFVIVILRLYINSISSQSEESRRKQMKVAPQDSCPWSNNGKLHKWQYDLVEGGYICIVCNRKPGSEQ